MSRIMMTGADGFIGKSLGAALLQQGFALRRVVRENRQSTTTGAQEIDTETFAIGDIGTQNDWTQALAGVDVVVHLAARVHIMREGTTDPLAEFRRVNVEATEHLARSAATADVKRLVYVSSIKVNGESTKQGRRFSETDTPAPQDAYGISKWEAEQALHRISDETGLEIAIVRPPLVYGPGVKGNFLNMLQVIDKGIPLPLASIHNQRSLIYLENLVSILIQCAIHPAAAGQTYLVSDGEDVSTPDLLRALASGMSKPSRLFRCPPQLLRLIGAMLGVSGQMDRLLGSLQIDDGKIRRQLNWIPSCTLQQGLSVTADWYRTTYI